MVAKRKYEVKMGQVFGNLTVISDKSFYPINGKTGKKMSTRSVEVKCTCGHIFPTGVVGLIKGRVTNCKYTKNHFEKTGESMGAHKFMNDKIEKQKENKRIADEERESNFTDYLIPILIALLVGTLIYIGLR